MQIILFLAAVFGLACVNGHMVMTSPQPFAAGSLTNAPLEASGADFPCKQRSDTYEADGASNTYPLGSTQTLAFKGTAVHGGGSCQVSITYDLTPTKSSVFKVIHSIEGGCPMKNVVGNNGEDANAIDPDTYSFTVPSSLPTGSAVVAWTWFNKVGNREMYMNCGPVTITGGSSKRDGNATQLMERDTATYNALPDMFTANIGNGCTTADSQDLKFPNPGEALDQFGLKTATPSAPSGSCATAVADSAGSAASGASIVQSSAAAASPTVSSAASAPTAESSSTDGPAGVFATTEVVSPTAAAIPTTSSAAAEAPVASSIVSSAAPASSASPASTASGSGSALTGACTSEGMFNCIGGTSFQQCASGVWSVAQPVAAGTSCTSGSSMAMGISAITAKRAVHFFA